MRNFLDLARAYWAVWVWKPFLNRMARFLGINDCCEQPDLVWTEGHGFSVQLCQNCKKSRTFYRNL